MATADGLIRITVDIDTSSFQSELKDIIKSLENLKKTIKNTFDDTAVKNFAQSCNDLSSSLNSHDAFDYIGALSNLLSIFDSLSEKVGYAVRNHTALRTAISESTLQVGAFLTKAAKLTGAIIANAAQWVAHAVVVSADTVSMWALNAAWTAYNVVCTISAAVTTAFGAAMNFLFGPIGLIIIAIVALIAVVWLLIANWDWVKEKAIEVWTAISEFFAGLWASITEAVTIAWQAIIDFIVGLWTGLSETAIAVWTVISDFFTQLWATITAAVTLAWQTIVDFLLGLWSGLSETAVAVWTGIADFFTGLMDNIKLAFSTAWEGIKEVWGVVAEWFTQNIIDPVQKAFEGFKTAVVGTWDGIWAGIKGVINSILGGIECFINSIIGGVNNLIANLNSVISLGSKVTEALGLGEIGFISPLGSISLPRLAKGAVIPPNRKFLALLGDQTSGTNIETPLTTMIDAFKTALTEMGGGSGDFTVTMPVYLDSEKIYEGQKRVQSRRGTSIVKVGATA